MKLLLLSEGDPEKPFAFSGTGKSLLDHLRAHGHTVRTVDVDLHGVSRYIAGAIAWRPARMRSWNASRRLATSLDGTDALHQNGPTIEPRGRGRTPYFLYCDSNQRIAQRSQFAVASRLTEREIEEVVARERSVYEGATRIFTISEYARRSFIEDFGIAPDRVQSVGAGPNIDLSRIPERSNEPRSGPPTILFVGGYFRLKGGQVLLRAFERVRAEIPDAKLIVIGARDEQVEAPGVEALGFLRKDNPEHWKKLLDAYASASVFAFPTLFDAFGIVLLEAMLFGLPCVATRNWAIPEIVADGETGYTFPMGDANELASRLLELLRDEEKARRMGAAGRARALSRYTWPAVVDRMSATMQAALP